MKKTFIKTTLALFIGLTLTSFTDKKVVEINIDESMTKWVGYKVTGQHEGTISFDQGQLIFEGNKLVGGKFVMDMTTINTTDIEGSYKKKLDNHLKSADFFGVDQHKKALLEFTSVKKTANGYAVDGNLTIKGIQNPVSFDMSVTGNTASANLKIDRTKFDIKYGSASFFDDLKDRAIYDEFDLTVKLSF